MIRVSYKPALSMDGVLWRLMRRKRGVYVHLCKARPENILFPCQAMAVAVVTAVVAAGCDFLSYYLVAVLNLQRACRNLKLGITAHKSFRYVVG